MFVASLHQGVTELLPTRLAFYENWIHPTGMRKGRIGLAPVSAVLSFLRQEGDAYRLVMARAGVCAADWTVDDLSRLRRGVIRRAPAWLRGRLVMGLARQVIAESRMGRAAQTRWRKGGGTIRVHGSLFCEVRERADHPLCDFYAAAVARLLTRFELPVLVETSECRACGGAECCLIARRTEASA